MTLIRREVVTPSPEQVEIQLRKIKDRGERDEVIRASGLDPQTLYLGRRGRIFLAPGIPSRVVKAILASTRPARP